MNNRIKSLLAIGAALLLLTGCGGSNNGSSSTTGPYNGIYRTSLTRGTSALTIYVDYPLVEAVVTDEAGNFPSYSGSSSTAASIVNGSLSFTAIPLTGSDGETASITGFEVSGSGGAPTLDVTIVGGLGFNGGVPQTTTNSNSLLVGSYTGSWTSTYTSTGLTSTQPAGSVTSFNITADSGTGGYDLTAAGTTTDPTGTAVSFSINDAHIDPCGIVSGMTVTYTYSNGTTPSVTNTPYTGYINLGVVATTSLIGELQATTTTWSGTPVETDFLNLTQTSAASKAKKK